MASSITTEHSKSAILSNNFTANDETPDNNDAKIFLLVGCYSFLGPLGVIGNLLVIIIVCKNTPMRNPTNFLLVNVAISDFLFVVITTPTEIMIALSKKIFTVRQRGNGIVIKLGFCTQIAYVFLLTISAISLATLAVERYNAMVYPMKIHRRLTKRGTMIVIFVTWITAAVLATPLVIKFLHNLTENTLQELNPRESRIYWRIFALMMPIIPIGIIAFCYGRIMIGIHVIRNICSQGSWHPQDRADRKKLTNMLLLVSLVFMIGHIPWTCSMVYHTFRNTYDGNWLLPIVIFHHLSPCLNSIIYVVYNTNYREGVKRLLKRNHHRSSSGLGTSPVERSQNDMTID